MSRSIGRVSCGGPTGASRCKRAARRTNSSGNSRLRGEREQVCSVAHARGPRYAVLGHHGLRHDFGDAIHTGNGFFLPSVGPAPNASASASAGPGPGVIGLSTKPCCTALAAGRCCWLACRRVRAGNRRQLACRCLRPHDSTTALQRPFPASWRTRPAAWLGRASASSCHGACVWASTGTRSSARFNL